MGAARQQAGGGRTALLLAAALLLCATAPTPASAAGPGRLPPAAAGRLLQETGVPPAAAEPVDGIAVIVNEEVITIGEVRRAALLLREADPDRPPGGCGGLGAEAVGFGVIAADAPGNDLDPAELEAARECLIDGALVFREARRFPQLDVTREQVNEAFQRLRDAFPDPAAFRRELERFGLTPEGVHQDLRRQLLVAAYIESRFRATVDVDEAEARTYYRDELAPDMEGRGIEPPPYEQVAEDFVLPILREREVNRRVESWIEDLRSRATIRRLYPAPEPDR